MFRKIKDIKGITLVEVLAILVILGILTTIAVPVAKKAWEQPEKLEHLNNAKVIAAALENMYIYGEFADTEISAGGASNGNTLLKEVQLQDIIALGYLDELKYPREGAYDMENSKGIVKCTKDGCTYDVVLQTEGAKDWYVINQASVYSGFSENDDFSCLTRTSKGGIDFIALSEEMYTKVKNTAHTPNCTHTGTAASGG